MLLHPSHRSVSVLLPMHHFPIVSDCTYCWRIPHETHSIYSSPFVSMLVSIIYYPWYLIKKKTRCSITVIGFPYRRMAYPSKKRIDDHFVATKKPYVAPGTRKIIINVKLEGHMRGIHKWIQAWNHLCAAVARYEKHAQWFDCPLTIKSDRTLNSYHSPWFICNHSSFHRILTQSHRVVNTDLLIFLWIVFSWDY